MFKRIYENTLAIGVGIIIGGIFGTIVTSILFKTSLLSIEESYDNGYKKAQQECVQLIKNTK